MSQDDYSSQKDEKFFNEFKEKMAIDPLSESVRHVERQASKRQVFTIIILVIMAVGAGICWNLYSSYIAMKEPVTEIPLLKADNHTYRARPENPDGMVVPNQDKTIYGRITVEEQPAEDEEIIVQKELPVPMKSTPDVQEAVTDTTKTTATTAAAEDMPKAIYTPSDRPVSESTAIDAAEQKAPADATQYQPLFSLDAAQNAEEKIEAEAKSAAKTETKVEPKVEPKAEVKVETKIQAKPQTKPAPAVISEEITVKAIAPVVSDEGDWRIQLLAAKDKVSAVKAWSNIYKKHNDLLAKYNYEVIEASVKGKTMYRLRIRSFDLKEDAEKVCSALKANKQDCIVVKK